MPETRKPPAGPPAGSLAERAAAFRRMHDGPELLLLMNAWDAASAVILAEAGFPALASTSAGVAFALGYPDGQHISRDEMIGAVARIVRHVRVPVTADLEAGYGPRPEDVADTVRAALGAGAVGANFEDNTGRGAPLRDIADAAERIRAAREAADAASVPFVINARTDGYLYLPDPGAATFDETVRRAEAYVAAGADCVFVPGRLDGETIGRLVQAIPAPLNVLGGISGPDGPSLPELKALGVRRVSVGGNLSLAALGVLRRAARELLSTGTFGYVADAVPHQEMNALLAKSRE